MEPTLPFGEIGPPTRALVLAGQLHPRARRAADRRVAEVVQRVVRKLVLLEVAPDLLAAPRRHRVDLHDREPGLELVALDDRRVRPRGRGVAAERGNPGVEVAERPVHGLHLVDVAAASGLALVEPVAERLALGLDRE